MRSMFKSTQKVMKAFLMRGRTDKKLILSIPFLISQKLDYAQSAKLPRMLLWLSTKPKKTKTKMINTKKTNIPRNETYLIFFISKYSMIAYLNVMMSSTNMIVNSTTF